MAKKPKKYRYNVSASFEQYGEKFSILTQLYQIGVYAIWNNDPALQGGYTPTQMERLFKKMKKDKEAGLIQNLELGREIVVTTDEKGFFIEVKE